MTVQAIRQQTANDAASQTAPAGSATSGGLSGAAFLALVRQSAQRYSGQGAIASAVSGLTGQLAAADEARDTAAAASRAQTQDTAASAQATATAASDRTATALATSAARARRDDDAPRVRRDQDDRAASDDSAASERADAASRDDAPAPVARHDDEDRQDQDKDDTDQTGQPLALVTPEVVVPAAAAPGDAAAGTPASPAVATTPASPAQPGPGQGGAAQPQGQAPAQSQAQLNAQTEQTAQQQAQQAAQTAGGNATDPRQAQSSDLAARLAGTGAGVAIAVQDDGTAPSPGLTPPAAGTVAKADPAAAQGQGNQNAGASGGQGGQTANGGTAAALAQASAAASEGEAAPAAESGDSFSALLAAQSKATGIADKTAPANPVTGLSAVAPMANPGRAQAAAPATATATTPRTLPAQVLEQISVHIDKAVKDGLDTVKIQLKPVELGKIEIKLEVASDGKVTATVTADKRETLAMLQNDQRGLEKALQDAGLKPDSSTTSFNLRGDAQSQQQQAANRDASAGQGQNQGQGQPRGRESGGYGGDPALAAALSALSTPASADGGVDISV